MQTDIHVAVLLEGQKLDARLYNISRFGVGNCDRAGLQMGAIVIVEFPNGESFTGHAVWEEDGNSGAYFEELLPHDCHYLKCTV